MRKRIGVPVFDDDVGGDDGCCLSRVVSWSVEQTTSVTVPPYPFADAYLPAMARTRALLRSNDSDTHS